MQTPNQKAGNNARMKKQTPCPPTIIVDETIAVNNEEDDQSPPNNNLSGEKLPSGIQNRQKLTRICKKVQRGRRELCFPTDVVTDISQVTKEHDVPSPPKEKETVQKENNSNPHTLEAVTNKEVCIEETSSEPPKLPLTAKEQDTETTPLPELEREQSVSLNGEDEVMKGTPSLLKGKSVIKETIYSVIIPIHLF